MDKISTMQRYFERDSTHKCRECINFHHYRYHDKMYSKCKVYGLSHAPQTDWSGRDEVCGMFGRDYDGIPVNKFPKDKIPDEPLWGQMELIDFICLTEVERSRHEALEM